MSDPGSIPLPAGPKIPGQTPQTGKIEPNARIVNTPADFRDLKQNVEITGKVIGENEDGSVRVRTARGDIDLQVTDRRVKLEPGDDVKVEIPPGNPPRNARVTETAETKPETPPPSSESAPPRGSSTPVNVDIRPPEAPQQTPATPQAETPQAQPAPQKPSTPREEQIVRLVAVTLEQVAAQLLPTETEDVSTTLQKLAETLARTVAQESLPPDPLAPIKPYSPLPAPENTARSTPAAPPSVITTGSAMLMPLTPDTAPPFLPAALPQGTPGAQTAAPLPNILTPQVTATTTIPTAQIFLTAPAPTAATSKAPGSLPTLTQILTALDTLPAATLPAIAPPILPTQTLPTAPSISVPQTGAPPSQAEAFISRISTPPNPVTPLPFTTPMPARTETTPAPQQDGLKQQPLLDPFHLQNTPPLILQNTRAGNFTAVVIGQTPRQLPVLAYLPPGAPQPLLLVGTTPLEGLTPGMQVQLAPAGADFIAVPAPPLSSLPLAPAYFLTPEPWPMMDEIYTSLAQAALPTAQAMSNMTPSPSGPAQLAATALFFIAALKGGDLSQWLGDRAVDTLRRLGKTGTLTRMGQESSALSRMASEPVAQDWRALTLPMMWDNHIHKIALYYKHDRTQDDEKDNQGGNTRFIFDLKFDRLGKIQLDGLFKGQRLDLMVRSEQLFSAPMQSDMRAIYADALGQTALTGELSFQNKPEQWVTIKPASQRAGIVA